MGGGDSLVWAPGVASAVAESFSSVQLAEAPILLLVYFHKAFREELSEVRRVLLVASESGSYSRDLVLDLVGRFEFIKLAYKYHCAAEDEVVFLALDAHIKNVACTYSLEHRGIDDLFKSIFNCFTMLMESDENISKPFNELVFCIGTIQTAICKHMLKEEQQVFPLLMQQFSSKEQASLVWQFICSVPVALLEDIMPWMTSFLSPEEQVDILHCIREVVPKEKLLQEVVISWLGNKIRPFGVYTNIGKAAQFQPSNFKYLSKLYSVDSFSGHWKKASFLQKNFKGSPVDGLHLWHGAIRKDWKEILEELYQIQSSNDFLNLASVIVQLKFLAEVLLFYSNALEKTFYPVLNEISNGRLSLSYGRFPNENQIEGLQKSLFYNAQSGEPLCKFVEKLCRGLESFVEGIDEHLASQEMEIFPVISKNCSHEMQQQLLYMSLHMMPLGLLRCVVTWFSTHFSEDQTKSILQNIKQGGPFVDKSFASLLLEWVSIGYSGKTSIEKFRTDLQEMFKTKCYFVTDQIEEDTVSDSLLLDAQHGKRSQTGLMEANPANKAKDSESGSSSSGFYTAEKYDTLYSSGINMHIFFPRTAKLLCPFPRFPGEESGSASIDNLEPSPIDHIFFFHKALKNDLQYLLFGSSQLAENIGSFMDFRRRFHLVQFLYQIHSDAEDEIAFPALEAKGKNVENISHSYTIDHKLEADLFNKISLILDEMSELHFSVTSVDTLDPRMLKYCQLCMKLHDMCKSLHKILCDHVQHEEVELWPLFRSYFSIKEQENVIGYMLGRTGSEILQEMIPWLMASLSPQEQQSIMFLWRKATKNTMFDEWLREWWEGMTEYDMAGIEDESDGPPSSITDPLEVVSAYLSKEGFSGARHETTIKITQIESAGAKVELSGNHSVDSKLKVLKEEKKRSNENEKKRSKMLSENENKINNEVADVTDRIDKPGHRLKTSQVFSHQEQLLKMSQDELEAAIRRVSRDSSLGSQKKSYIMQNLLMSRWIVTQQKFHSEVTIASNVDGIPGQGPSYRDPLKLTFGCKHYKRNCKLLSACCNQLYTCRYCHDNVADHSMDRKATTKMMCMKCLVIQPVGPTCSTASCNNLSMAKYYCRICKFFDDEREIYHCPYCNLCRLGKGLGIDYFHCMNCNACMSRSLSVHICREKCFEDNCPICHEYIFTSSAPVKALSCGHLMHSACFQEYTCTHYTCPICSKSLGDMQVYFGMLDALLAEEKISDEYSGQTQEILCNDCEKKGTAPFHWLYHKCSYCGSYNTRLL